MTNRYMDFQYSLREAITESVDSVSVTDLLRPLSVVCVCKGLTVWLDRLSQTLYAFNPFSSH